MRKIVSIALLLVFVLAHYGKLASYIYCKWQAEVKLQHCDCEKKLVADTKKDHNEHSPLLHIKQVVEEPFVKTNTVSVSLPINDVQSYPLLISTSIAQGFEHGLLRPPGFSLV